MELNTIHSFVGIKGEPGAAGLTGMKGQKGEEGRPLPFNQQCCSSLCKYTLVWRVSVSPRCRALGSHRAHDIKMTSY